MTGNYFGNSSWSAVVCAFVVGIFFFGWSFVQFAAALFKQKSNQLWFLVAVFIPFPGVNLEKFYADFGRFRQMNQKSPFKPISRKMLNMGKF